eukprot:m.100748 g.100748  ORF g.100748 m.100748 type:complete len:582 (-) comp15140_c0_seq1:64-1809(-)
MFTCRLCKTKLGDSRLSVVEHWRDEHPNEQPSDVCPGTKAIRCEACTWVGATPRNYGQHLQDMHPETALQLFKHIAPLAKACECGKLFSGHSGLQGHRKTCSKAATGSKPHKSKTSKCHECGVILSTKSMNRHLRIKHPNVQIRRPSLPRPKTILCAPIGEGNHHYHPGQCSAAFETRREWLEHVNTVHNANLGPIHQLSFESYDAFLSWRREQELANCTGYTPFGRTLWTCAQEYSSDVIARFGLDGGRRANYCYAYITTRRLRSGRIEVEYFPYHFHDCLPEHIPINAPATAYVRKLANDGLSMDQILAACHEQSEHACLKHTTTYVLSGLLPPATADPLPPTQPSHSNTNQLNGQLLFLPTTISNASLAQSGVPAPRASFVDPNTTVNASDESLLPSDGLNVIQLPLVHSHSVPPERLLVSTADHNSFGPHSISANASGESQLPALPTGLGLGIDQVPPAPTNPNVNAVSLAPLPAMSMLQTPEAPSPGLVESTEYTQLDNSSAIMASMPSVMPLEAYGMSATIQPTDLATASIRGLSGSRAPSSGMAAATITEDCPASLPTGLAPSRLNAASYGMQN